MICSAWNVHALVEGFGDGEALLEVVAEVEQLAGVAQQVGAVRRVCASGNRGKRESDSTITLNIKDLYT
jgi:hypothetical protein